MPFHYKKEINKIEHTYVFNHEEIKSILLNHLHLKNVDIRKLIPKVTFYERFNEHGIYELSWTTKTK
jgi:hypothetical protein